MLSKELKKIASSIQAISDHVVFIDHGTYVSYRFGDATGSTPTESTSSEAVIKQEFARLQKDYPGLKTMEVFDDRNASKNRSARKVKAEEEVDVDVEVKLSFTEIIDMDREDFWKTLSRKAAQTDDLQDMGYLIVDHKDNVLTFKVTGWVK